MRKFRKPKYHAESLGVGKGFYPAGINLVQTCIDLLKELESPEISESTSKKLERFKKPIIVRSTNVYYLEPDLDQRIFNSAMRFRVTEYNRKLFLGFPFIIKIDNSAIQFLKDLKSKLPRYKSKFLTPLAEKTRIERDESNLWPTISANPDRSGDVKLLSRYIGKNESNNSLIEAMLVSNYLTYGPDNKPGPFSDDKFVYTRFTNTPYSDGVTVLVTFRDFSYKNCSFIKRK